MESENPTRRRFLKVLVLGSFGAAVAGFAVLRFPYWAIREWWLRLDTKVAPGELQDLHLRVLMAVTETVTDRRIERTHYEEFFRWHALTLPGHKGLYERIGAMLDREANVRGCASFADCTDAMRLDILARLQSMHRSRVRRMLSAAVNRNWLLLDSYVVQPVLDLFVQTDAWVLLGYPTWPGVARGFEFHLHSKTRRSNSAMALPGAKQVTHAD